MAKITQSEIIRSSSRSAIYNRRQVEPKKNTLWDSLCKFTTFLIPNCLLSMCGMKSKGERDAWREKFTLCTLIFYACVFLAFLTYGMNTIVCKSNNKYIYSKLDCAKFDNKFLIARGSVYTIDEGHRYYDELTAMEKKNLTALFENKVPECQARFRRSVIERGVDGLNISLKNDQKLTRVAPINFTWADVSSLKYIVINDKVYDPSQNTEVFYSDFINNYRGKDATNAVNDWVPSELACFKDTFLAGDLLTKSYGCLVADFVLYISTVAIFGLIIVRFILAMFYYWIIRSRTKRLMQPTQKKCEMPVIMLVTCYSEDRDGLKGTLNSLCQQDYDVNNRLIVVVADGAIKGDGSDQTTHEILRNLVAIDKNIHIVPKEYIAIAGGSKRLNRAAVIPGTYKYGNKVSKILLILKCGNEDEVGQAKAGNRGKRDSQIILMGFFSRLLFDELLSPLDYEIYKMLLHLHPHIHPAKYEGMLMVDADTIVDVDALSQMVKVFEYDSKIIGMCGETKISNKGASWVTAIQVFEYYISHHLNKSFESVFGGVTCIPGCFGMYRIQLFKKTGTAEYSLPVLAHPYIIQAYSVFQTTTLHQKNLLLLGEDRYLTTLLLKNFYKRKLIFNPSATCKTEVPDKFKVLLSQRRRWINSTIHNYFELALVDKLCGTFCCSMQFVVIMELMGTLVLPAAIVFTGVLIASAFLFEPAWIPIIMLFGILGLPAILIGITTFEVSQLFWLIIYIFSLPVWNLILPTYAFWHFDDFSWGETRKVQGEDNKGHGEAEGDADMKKCKRMLLKGFLAADLKLKNVRDR
ncbi:hypothetical protein EDEG_01376 [Edhazardia aedis USNM 41457]|uniref:chitin synthase n=1 Tax=Edhazardia aedis (strain USNM 41457) TaxID=1003232 RepID=J9DPB0_EDHAE|nr:hypothetical protein EDEG_01376 [Edhazardia aedis USNM 41457]|eukprot:EJW04385.1 hypothetical protein EDEG_01376 [Edhazardia aedis USNM 41457]